MKRIYMLGVCFSAPFFAFAAYPTIQAGEKDVLSSERTETEISVAGTLEVVTGGKGALAAASTVKFGSPAGSSEPAQIKVSGGSFGSANNNTTPTTVNLGDDGGRGHFLVTGGKLGVSKLNISDAAQPDESGYIDFLRLEGGTALFRQSVNNNTCTARVVVVGRSAKFGPAHGWWPTMLSGKGPFLIEGEDGALVNIDFDNVSETTVNTTPTRVVGAADCCLLMTGDGVVIKFSKNFRFDNDGAVILKTTKSTLGQFRFNASGIIGAGVTNLVFQSAAQLKLNSADVEIVVRDVTSETEKNLIFGLGTVVADANPRDIAVNVAFGDSVTLRKTGAGKLSLGTLAACVPTLDVREGSVEVRGETSITNFIAAAGTGLVVNGGRLTFEVGTFSFAGNVFKRVNGGSIIVRATSSSMPVFSAGASFDVNEYWLDGVRQESGTYTVGGATLNVSTYDESGLSVWKNADSAATSVAFPAGSRYLGLSLSTPPESIVFTGGDLTLGSSGIAVDDAAGVAPTYDFSLPLNVGSSQKWTFGTASAVFRGPLRHAADMVGVPLLEIVSSAAIAFEGNDSSFCGSISAQANTFTVAGQKPFGPADVGGTVTLAASGDGAQCCFAGCRVEKPLKCSLPSAINIYNCRFAAGTTNVFNGLAHLSQWTEFEAGSYTEFNGGARFDGYNRQRLGGGAVVVFKGGYLDYHNDGGNHGMAPVTVYGESGTMVFDCEVGIESGEKVDISELVSLDMRRPYAFSAGKWELSGTMLLNGHSQTATRFMNSNGTISSTNAPAFVELNLPAGAAETNALKFTDLAGFKMTGAGFVRMNGVSTSSGALAVENGTVELGAATWLNATNVAVGGTGVLKLTKSNAFDRRKAVLSLSADGSLDLPEGVRQSFLAATVTVDGDELKVPAGTYGADATGLMAGRVTGGGTVTVISKGFSLIVR